MAQNIALHIHTGYKFYKPKTLWTKSANTVFLYYKGKHWIKINMSNQGLKARKCVLMIVNLANV